jgi:uncharacterized protein YjaG (DUF416 family)
MDKFLASIEKQLEKLSHRHRVLFTALTCEKMIPSFRAFSSKMRWGNVEIMEEALILQYQYINSGQKSDSEIDDLYSSLEINTPNNDDFDDISTSYAIDSCVVFLESMAFLKTGHIHHSLNVASSARDTIDMFIQEKESIDPNDSNLETLILSDPYMLKEQKRQNAILSALSESPVINSESIQRLRELNDGFGLVIDIEFIS